ncbi:MAG: tRNA (adenosine(37)-N6)-threonylcarbamoyltransferase complex ATPase subunit type 1 TsaE [Alphaproteobacteria bacterium]|nr:tRNA (adenosine(37)-N6)-threonylcarbamoyltransferase complex ATPase subunit type 1 TsaE [Alphaproteobacteria bacterium]
MKKISLSETDTLQFAKEFSNTLKGDEIIALWGTLGMGKTVFARGIIQSLLGKKEEVPSPTFTLLQTYNTPKGEVFHFDFYRLKSPDEAYEIGIEDAFESGICLIEWPEKIGSLLPKNTINVYFEMTSKGRQISIGEKK